MKKEIEDAMLAAVRKNEEVRREAYKRSLVLNLEICPDCGGKVKEVTSLWAKFWLTERAYVCQSCGSRHVTTQSGWMLK